MVSRVTWIKIRAILVFLTVLFGSIWMYRFLYLNLFRWSYVFSMLVLILFDLFSILAYTQSHLLSWKPMDKKVIWSVGDKLKTCYIGLDKIGDKGYKINYYEGLWIGFELIATSAKTLKGDEDAFKIDSIIKSDLNNVEKKILFDRRKVEKEKEKPKTLKDVITNDWDGVVTDKINLLRDEKIDKLLDN